MLSTLVILEKLLETMHAELFLAEDAQADQRLVVLKRSRPVSPVTRTTCRSDGTDREATIVNRVQQLPSHDNILRYYHTGVRDNRSHVVMEYCPRGDLFGCLVSRPDARMTDHEALHVVLHLARGLRHLHRHNIAHRDLSLENVLIGERGVFKICDFGLACEADQLRTDKGYRMYYMAPEMMKDAPYDPKKADMWSLGIILYIMLTGTPLLGLASSETKEFRAIRDIGCSAVFQLWQIEHFFSDVTLDLLSTLLQVDPASRFQSVEHILSHPAVVGAASRAAATSHAFV